jgi:hypothetical protein
LFEYGTSSSYGSTSSCASAPGSGTGQVAVSASLTGLGASSTYHYRIVAANEKGKSEGEDHTFTTSAPPPSPSPITGPLPGTIGVLPAQESRPPVVPNAALVNTILAAARSGTVTLKVSCPTGESSCTGSLTLRTLSAVTTSVHGSKARKAILALGQVAFTIVGGSVKALSLHLYPSARALLARTHPLRVRATIVAHDPTGAVATSRTNAILRAPAALAGRAP